jgi:lipoate-protein ligase A
MREDFMYLFDLGHLPGQQSMLIFHALARMNVEALVLVSPEVPLVSVGYFQDAQAEVDLRYCQQVELPIMRREIGGGATYLDGNQIFYQVIMRRDNARLPGNIAQIYERFSQPAVETYAEFGIETHFRSVNDIVTTEGRKIAGEGGADIGPCMVFVGGILMDFDYLTMSKVLKVPDEKFRDKVFKSMEENLTTMRRELGEAPPRHDVRSVLVEKFQNFLGPLEPASLNREIMVKMEQLERQFTSPEFLYKKTPKVAKGVKIREGVEVLYGLHKAPGGLIRTVQEVADEQIQDVGISGDFTFYPKVELGHLEGELQGARRRPADIRPKIEKFYESRQVQSPGVDADDLMKAMEVADQ